MDRKVTDSIQKGCVTDTWKELGYRTAVGKRTVKVSTDKVKSVRNKKGRSCETLPVFAADVKGVLLFLFSQP